MSKLTLQDTPLKANTPWFKMGRNRNVIPDFPRDGSGNLQLMTARDFLAAHIHRLSIYPSTVCVSCKDDKAVMNQDIF